MKARQTSFAAVSNEFKDYWKNSGRKVHGGVYAQGKRKTARPFSSKKPLHLVLRASRAKGNLSLWNHKAKVNHIINKFSRANRVKIYEFSNNGNHLHLVVKAKDRQGFQKFLRTTSGLIARAAMNAKKAQAKGKFWDSLAFTRLSEWGKAYKTVQSYVLQNILEAAGAVTYKPRRLGHMPSGIG